MYLNLIFSSTLLLFLFSCGNNSTQAEMKLNNGVKWHVNAEMMPPLEASKNLILEFATHDEKDYKTLAEKLKKNNDLLISSCTMEGKSHDELHKWLHPYMGLVHDLKNADDTNEATQTFLKIEQSFITFDTYFQ